MHSMTDILSITTMIALFCVKLFEQIINRIEVMPTIFVSIISEVSKTIINSLLMHNIYAKH